MSLNNEQLDKLFSDKLNDSEIEFNPADWIAAKKLIDTEKPRKKRWIPWFLASLGLLGLVVTWNLNQSKHQSLLLAENTESLSSIEAGLSADQLGKESESQAKSNVEQRISSSADQNTKSLASSSNDVLSSDPAKQQETGHVPTSSNEKFSDAQQKPRELFTDTYVKQRLPSTSYDDVQNEDHHLVSNNNRESSYASLAGRSILPDEVQDFEQAVITASQKDLLRQRSFLALEDTIEWISHLAYGLSLNEMRSTLHVAASDLDFEPHASLGFFFEGLINPFFDTEELFAGFKFGLNAQYHLSEQWAIQVQPNYNQRVGLDLYSNLKMQTEYGFTSTTVIYAKHAQSLHQLGIPISVLHTKDKHQFEVGLDVNYLLGVQGEVREVTLVEGINNPGVMTRSKIIDDVVQHVQEGWIDMTSFRSTNNHIFIGYHYLFSKGASIGTRLYYQPNGYLKKNPDELIPQKNANFTLGLQAKFILE